MHSLITICIKNDIRHKSQRVEKINICGVRVKECRIQKKKQISKNLFKKHSSQTRYAWCKRDNVRDIKVNLNGTKEKIHIQKKI